jgi:hypothetical protein
MFKDFIDALPELLKELNYGRMVQIIILSFVFLILYSAWDSRVTLVDAIKAGAVNHKTNTMLIANEATVKAIKALVSKNPLMMGVQLVNTDFRNNARTTAFFYANRPELQNIIDSAVYNRASPTPILMVTNGTPEEAAFALQNNIRMIDIINAQFVCVESKGTGLAQIAMGFPALAPWMCSISIPPYRTKFSGYLNVFLTRQPTQQEKVDIADAVTSLSGDIFDREISH